MLMSVRHTFNTDADEAPQFRRSARGPSHITYVGISRPLSPYGDSVLQVRCVPFDDAAYERLRGRGCKQRIVSTTHSGWRQLGSDGNRFRLRRLERTRRAVIYSNFNGGGATTRPESLIEKEFVAYGIVLHAGLTECLGARHGNQH
jgi:hypothetical protein